INGTIATSNPANFFLLNPNGILFGSGAQLNIGGSFLATTANRMQFQDRTEFNTTSPTPLLTINTPIGLQFGTPQGSIQLQGSRLLAEVTDSFENITLIGNSVSLNNTEIQTTGNVSNINIQANALRLENDSVLRTTPSGQGRSGNIIFQVEGNVSILDSRIFSELEFGRTGFGGDIRIQAGSFFMKSFTNPGGSQAFVTAASSGTGNAGSLVIQTRDAVLLDQSFISSNLNFNAIGRGGDITIDAGSVSLTTGAFVNNNTFGIGDSGNITLKSKGSITLANSSSILSGTEGLANGGSSQDAIGNGGNITLTSNSLSLFSGSEISSTSFGKGNGGNITVDSQAVSIDGIDQAGFVSGLLSSVAPGAAGKSGNITVSTDSLSITNGGAISASLGGEGKPGNITVNAPNEISIDGFGLYRFNQNLVATRSGIFTLIDRPGKVVDTSGEVRSGGIVINTGSLRLANNGALSSSTFGDGDAGDITINALNQVSLAGGSFSNVNISSGVDRAARGQGGNIRITTGSLLATNRAELNAGTEGQGNAGNIIIDARDLVSFDNSSGAFSTVKETARGKSGDIQVTARALSLTSGGELSASTFGQGKAGNISIHARDGIGLDGVGDDGFSSGLFTITERGATGSAGNITTNSTGFQVKNGATVNARTNSASDGGSITIKADRFEALKGGQVITTTRSNGRAGDINLYIVNQIVLAGRDSTYGDRLTQFGRDVIDTEGSASGLFANTASGSSGNGGSIFIDPRTLAIRDGARISVDSQGSGTGGNIQIQAGTLTLDNQGIISAQTASNQGGNIALNAQDLLLFRRGSQISTTAGTAQSSGDGGNININSKFIVSVLSENSDITANAFTGKGGRVDITAQSIFGIQPRSFLTPLSDITASSQFGISGVVTIATLNTDPSRGLVALPINLVDPANQIAQGCRSSGATGRFVVSGRGGLPSTPNDALDRSDLWEDARVTAQTTETVANLSSAKIVEATSWVKDATGAIVLVTQQPDSPGYLASQPAPTHCYVP
ncbi:two-partner secretion domain-containing protein, partial [Phormidesmis sp. 146-33]